MQIFSIVLLPIITLVNPKRLQSLSVVIHLELGHRAIHLFLSILSSPFGLPLLFLTPNIFYNNRYIVVKISEQHFPSKGVFLRHDGDIFVGSPLRDLIYETRISALLKF